MKLIPHLEPEDWAFIDSLDLSRGDDLVIHYHVGFSDELRNTPYGPTHETGSRSVALMKISDDPLEYTPVHPIIAEEMFRMLQIIRRYEELNISPVKTEIPLALIYEKAEQKFEACFHNA